MEETKRAAGYIRVSTHGQAQDGVSLDAQEASIRAWCEANGYKLGKVYRDNGVSGKRADNRPGLQKALGYACRTKGAFVAYSLSRVARSTKDTIAIAERLENAGADLVSLSEKIDTTSAAGRMLFRMLAVLAEFERDVISERTKAALAHKKSKGERVGGVPFGYRIADNGVSLVPYEPEQEAVKTITALRREGRTLQAIADELKQRKIPNRAGSCKWWLNTISSIAKQAGC